MSQLQMNNKNFLVEGCSRQFGTCLYPYFFVFHVKFKFTFQIWHPQPGSLIAPPPSPGTGMEGFPPPPPLHAVCPQLPRNSSPGNRSWEGGIDHTLEA